ncbi:MAG: ABC transporter permease [bacterium]
MSRYLFRRLAAIVVVLAGTTFLTFMFVHLLPGDPARLMAGYEAGQMAIALVRHELGLDRPLMVQYWIYLQHLLHGSLGISSTDGSSVAADIRQAFGPTLNLTVVAMGFALVVGLSSGIFAALEHQDFVGLLLTSMSVFGISVPWFVLGLVLIWIFGVDLRLVPTGGNQRLSSIILPAVTLGWPFASTISRITRAQMLEVLSQDYVRTAHSKGLTAYRVILRHVFRNGLVPILTVIGLQFGGLISGAIVVETVFAWPGIGQLLISSITLRNYPVIQGLILMFALEFLLINVLVDLLYVAVDPRIRYS